MAVGRPILVILGPTASGKSALAVEAARGVGAEILSVDSMLVYRHMDIGTAKPSREHRQEVKHHLIDVVDPTEVFTVARFVEVAEAVIRDAARRRVPLIATGGTPLYYKALFEGLFEGPPADEAIRQRLRSLSNDELTQRLAMADPRSAARIHRNDTKRLVRALEVLELTGKPISSLQNEWAAGQLRHPAVWIGLQWSPEALNRRINARVKTMVAGGWREETKQLLNQYGALSPTAAEATGYREMLDVIAGRLTLDEAAEQIKIATRQLARRQMKWFRRWPQVRWLRGDQPIEALAEEATRHWAVPLTS